MTISEAFSAYETDILASKAPKTTRNYRTALQSFLRANGVDLAASLVTYQHVMRWKVEMNRRGMQSSSQASNLSRLRSVYRYLRTHKIPVSLDWEEIERPRVVTNPPVWLESDEVRRFLAAITNPRDKCLFAGIFSSGARISELLQLNRDSIIRTTYGCTADIIGKGDKPGTLQFDHNWLVLMDGYLATRSDSLRPLFVSSQRRRITVSRVEQLCHEYADSAGLEKNVTPHVGRHTFATRLKLNGMDIYDLKVQLRHKNISTTEMYVHTDNKKEDNYARYHSPVPL